MRIESQRDLYPLQYESAEKSTQQLLKSCDLLDKLWKKLLAKTTPPKKTPQKRTPGRPAPKKAPAKPKESDVFKTPEGQVLLILLDELKKSNWDIEKALTSLQKKTKGYDELQKATQEVQKESQKPVSPDAEARFGSNPEEILNSLSEVESTVAQAQESSPVSKPDSTSDTSSDSSPTDGGGSETSAGETVSGTDKDGVEHSGEVVQMSFGRPMIETDNGTTVTLTKWSSVSDDYSLFY